MVAKSWMQSKGQGSGHRIVLRTGQKSAKSHWLSLACALALTCTGTLQANTLPPAPTNDSEPAQVETFAVPEAAQRTTAPAPATPPTTGAPALLDVSAPSEKITQRRVALLLPLRSENLGPVAEVIKSGFLAAWESEQDGITVNVIESGESAADILDSYQLALAQHDVLVGPLPRAGVSSLINSSVISKPTIALNSPEARTPNDPPPTKLPNNLLIMGLSVEDEARQLANMAFANSGSAKKALVLSSNIAWQRRAAKAFAQQWQKLGGEVMQQEIYSSSGFLSAAGIATLKNRLQMNKAEKTDNAEKSADKPADKATEKANDKAQEKLPTLAFIALDAEQTRQLRHAIGYDLPLYGTSQLNRNILTDGQEPDPIMYLDGVRLLEIPWQLQRDHPAVMIYPRLIQEGEQKRSADLERLYALGIDSYRVARALAMKPGKAFELDGVTGKLQISIKKDAFSFERISPSAIYRQGRIQLLNPNPQ